MERRRKRTNIVQRRGGGKYQIWRKREEKGKTDMVEVRGDGIS